MRKIRVVLGSNDGETIIPDHMGTAKEFYIFDVFMDGRSVLVEKRENTSPQEDEKEIRHGDVRKLKSAMEIFEDCEVVLSRRGSPNFVRMRDNSRFQPVVSRVDSLSDLMHGLAESFEELFDLVARRKKGETPRVIPVIGSPSGR
ncbi:MAG: hypothetical protein JW929_05620 [Anaerolineales bacterium]|nr:hypothetical protein [Anaerolineales bacterium]